MFRKAMRGRRNRSLFRSTHDLTRKINLAPVVPRGGIRL